MTFNKVDSVFNTEVTELELATFGKVITNKDGIIQITGLDEVVVGAVVNIGDTYVGMVINI